MLARIVAVINLYFKKFNTKNKEHLECKLLVFVIDIEKLSSEGAAHTRDISLAHTHFKNCDPAVLLSINYDILYY